MPKGKGYPKGSNMTGKKMSGMKKNSAAYKKKYGKGGMKKK